MSIQPMSGKQYRRVLVENWVTAWSLSRELPAPVNFKSGFKVDVGDEHQKSRYVFPTLNDELIRLSESIDEPWIFLKVCASTDDLKGKISKKWTIQPQGFMMTCFRPMLSQGLVLQDGYKFEFEHNQSTFVLKIVAQNGELASTGRIVLFNDLAVYDRISTEVNHRRKGLARILMKELEKIALSKGISKNLLVATQEGKLLYESLGWEVYSLYTSIVIAG